MWLIIKALIDPLLTIVFIVCNFADLVQRKIFLVVVTKLHGSALKWYLHIAQISALTSEMNHSV